KNVFISDNNLHRERNISQKMGTCSLIGREARECVKGVLVSSESDGELASLDQLDALLRRLLNAIRQSEGVASVSVPRVVLLEVGGQRLLLASHIIVALAELLVDEFLLRVASPPCVGVLLASAGGEMEGSHVAEGELVRVVARLGLVVLHVVEVRVRAALEVVLGGGDGALDALDVAGEHRSQSSSAVEVVFSEDAPHSVRILLRDVLMVSEHALHREADGASEAVEEVGEGIAVLDNGVNAIVSSPLLQEPVVEDRVVLHDALQHRGVGTDVEAQFSVSEDIREALVQSR
ncbi:hypothetical protein PMAYCL1PPCAC_03447, partial [Pristionchus mayeri]